LKKYRLETSRAEGIAAYFIFTNDQLKRLISAKPGSLGELVKATGFNEAKCQKYGESILDIIRKYQSDQT